MAGFATGGRLAALDKAAARYLRSASAVDGTGTPWHHQLRGSNFEFISDLLDRPLVLLAVAAGCLAIGCSEYLWPLLLSLLSVRSSGLLVANNPLQHSIEMVCFPWLTKGVSKGVGGM